MRVILVSILIFGSILSAPQLYANVCSWYLTSQPRTLIRELEAPLGQAIKANFSPQNLKSFAVIDTSKIFAPNYAEQVLSGLTENYLLNNPPLNNFGEKPASLMFIIQKNIVISDYVFPHRPEIQGRGLLRTTTTLPQELAKDLAAVARTVLRVMRNSMPKVPGKKLVLSDLRLHVHGTMPFYSRTSEFHADGDNFTVLVPLTGIGTLYTENKKYKDMTADESYAHRSDIKQLAIGHMIIMSGQTIGLSAKGSNLENMPPTLHAAPRNTSGKGRLLLVIRFNLIDLNEEY